MASRVGTWEYDVTASQFRCDATAAALWGLSPGDANRGVSVERPRAAIHVEDRPRVAAEFNRAIHHGGLIVVEYRTRPGSDGIRWLLVRGCYEADEAGRTVGRGIVIDVTESKQDGYAEGRAHFLSIKTARPAAGPLDHLADLVLQARRVIDRIGGRTGAFLRPLVDALLFGIGRQIAARLDGPDDGEDGTGDVPERRH